MKARRDRQSLINMPHADDERGRDTDIHTQDVEPSTESVSSRNNTSADSHTVTYGHRKNTDVSFTASSEASLTMTKESHSHMPVVDKMKNCSLTEAVSYTDSQKHVLMDVCNKVTATKTLDTSVACDVPLPKKSCDQAPKTKTVECPRFLLFSGTSCHKALSTQSTSKQSMSTDSHRKDTPVVSLRSSFANNTERSASYMCNSKHTAVQHDESLFAAAVSVSSSSSKTAESTSAFDAQSISRSVGRQSTGSCVTLGSMIDANAHQMVTPDCGILQPSIATHQQNRVRFEGNRQLLQIPVFTLIFFW